MVNNRQIIHKTMRTEIVGAYWHHQELFYITERMVPDICLYNLR